MNSVKLFFPDPRSGAQRGSHGNTGTNPDMELVTRIMDLKPTSKNAQLTVIVLRYDSYHGRLKQ